MDFGWSGSERERERERERREERGRWGEKARTRGKWSKRGKREGDRERAVGGGRNRKTQERQHDALTAFFVDINILHSSQVCAIYVQ